MSRQSEFKMKLDPELGRYTRQHIYGEGMMDVFKSFRSKLFGKTMKKLLKIITRTKLKQDLDLLLIIQENPLLLIGITHDYQWILK